ncbi:signal peptidase I SipW [Melghiribacillus thermohalophilus]|uniref:signal peptidase I SipW n=1 Tax=Melghiribacillus thermohalophilus TaxID=1324956 RepID=UPI0010451056
MKKARKWIGRIITYTLMTVLVIMLFFVITSKLSGGPPQVFGYQIMKVLSGSMEPTIDTGSLIAVKPVSNTEKLDEGTVITYQSIDNPDVLITHRIVEVQESDGTISYMTKGDNNDSRDAVAVPSENVVGVFSGFTIPWLGYFFTFVQSKMGIVMFIIVPGVILILSQIYNIFKSIGRLNGDKAS